MLQLLSLPSRRKRSARALFKAGKSPGAMAEQLCSSAVPTAFSTTPSSLAYSYPSLWHPPHSSQSSWSSEKDAPNLSFSCRCVAQLQLFLLLFSDLKSHLPDLPSKHSHSPPTLHQWSSLSTIPCSCRWWQTAASTRLNAGPEHSKSWRSAFKRNDSAVKPTLNSYSAFSTQQ